MARRKIFVDGQGFYTKEEALKFFGQAIMGTDGSEKERMCFAYFAIQEGCKHINTYKEIAI